jgi:hypothetical protein
MLGVWTGTYKYTVKYFPILDKAETGFTMTITDFDGIHFKGTVTDDIASGGTKGVGEIIGTIRNGLIKFVKKMPIMTLRCQDGEKFEISKNHRPIHYKGILTTDNIFTGKWKIKWGIIFFDNNIGFSFGTKGTWQMQKKGS